MGAKFEFIESSRCDQVRPRIADKISVEKSKIFSWEIIEFSARTFENVRNVGKKAGWFSARKARKTIWNWSGKKKNTVNFSNSLRKCWKMKNKILFSSFHQVSSYTLFTICSFKEERITSAGLASWLSLARWRTS